MKLSNLVKTIDQMTDEELIERLRIIRHNREVAKPAVRQRVERSEKKSSRIRVSAAEKLLVGLSEEERRQLILQLGEQDG
jgi:DNA-binding MarR family transcriptional regulator